jgi:dihydroxyacetone kinase-like predicted kinase
LTILLEGMLRLIEGEPLDTALAREFQTLDLEAVGAAMEAVEPGQDWEVVIDFRPRWELELSSFYNRLEKLGTSIQLGQGDDLCRMHIHLPKDMRYEPIEFVETLGTVVNVHMENLLDQVDQLRGGGSAAGPAARLMEQQEVEPGQIASIAVAPGSGIADAFVSLGAARVVAGGQTMNPSTEQEHRHGCQNGLQSEQQTGKGGANAQRPPGSERLAGARAGRRPGCRGGGNGGSSR